jgi:hypothetical protein
MYRPETKIFGNTVVRDQHRDAWRKGLNQFSLLLAR